MDQQAAVAPVVDPDLATLTSSQVAKLIGVTERTLFKFRQAGEIGYLQTGGRIRFLHRHVTDYLASCEVSPKRSASKQ